MTMTRCLSRQNRSSRIGRLAQADAIRVEATPDDSWHMFEQSGRLFVPNCRTQELEEKRRLVRRAARRIKDCFVGRCKASSAHRSINRKASSHEIGSIVSCTASRGQQVLLDAPAS